MAREGRDRRSDVAGSHQEVVIQEQQQVAIPGALQDRIALPGQAGGGQEHLQVIRRPVRQSLDVRRLGAADQDAVGRQRLRPDLRQHLGQHGGPSAGGNADSQP